MEKKKKKKKKKKKGIKKKKKKKKKKKLEYWRSLKSPLSKKRYTVGSGNVNHKSLFWRSQIGICDIQYLYQNCFLAFWDL